jgi:dTDP-4-dehydrorhamnose reductase
MKILVIGGTGGMIANALAAVSSPDLDVTAIGRPHADLGDPDTLARTLNAHEADVVVCAGAFTRVDDAESHIEEAEQVNAHGPAALARLCARHGLPLVHISTDYVFDGAKGAPYAETDTAAPLSIYGRTKRAGEIAVLGAGARCAVVRTSWVHAQEGRNFVRTMLRLAKTQTRIRVVDDQRGSPTFAGHAADAIATISQCLVRQMDPALTGLFHMTSSGTCTWREFADAIFEGARLRGGPFAETIPITTAEFPTPARRPATTVLDTSKLLRAYGVALPDWRHGLDACLDVIAENGWRVDDRN